MTRRDWILFSSIAAAGPRAWAVGEKWQAPAVEDMKAKVTLDGITIGVEAFDRQEKAEKVFGKLDPNKFEVLPVLLGIKNGRKTAIQCGSLELQYIVPGQGKVNALQPDEVRTAGGGPSRPNLGPKPLPIPTRVKKNPLSSPEIEGRAFSAKMIAAGESATGFVYFNIRHRANGKFFLSGLVDAATKQEIFYFEVPFEN